MIGTFISVGNSHQKFDRLFHSLPKILRHLPKPVLVQSGHNKFLSSEATVIPFLPMDEFTFSLKKSTLVIIHGGAGSIINALNVNKTPLVIPRRKFYKEHIDDHQYELSLVLNQLNRIVMINSPNEIIHNIKRVIQFQNSKSNNLCDTNLLKSEISNNLHSFSYF